MSFVIFNDSPYNISIIDKINGTIDFLFPDEYYTAAWSLSAYDCYIRLIPDFETPYYDLPKDYTPNDSITIQNFTQNTLISHYIHRHAPIKSIEISFFNTG